MSTTMLTLFASCPKGVESVLAVELQALGAQDVTPTVAGVSFAGSLELAYRACLWSHLASRILLRIGEVGCADKHALYQGVQSFDWDEHLDQNCSFRVDFNGTRRTSPILALALKSLRTLLSISYATGTAGGHQ